ncbi:HNH endonuclease signature motif containing protein [Leifsonia kafniensis]|uniref:HNH endonuclease signature motif containing protein n=1 Tax=Leifsonia kafniensis TaxID=475957 RepID=A0ABP7KB00_9MICO
MERFGEQLDRAAQSHHREAVVAAETVLEIDRTRLLSERLTILPETESNLRQRWANRRVLVSELAAAFDLPERTMETKIEVGKALIHTLPDTFAALQAGQISYRHAVALADQTFGLSPEDKAELERAVLPGAGDLIVSKFTQKARKARERLDPASITVRHQKSVADRAVFFDPAPDGMAYLSAFLPATQAQAICTRLTGTAMGLQRSDEPRTLTQLKADVLVDLILDRDEPDEPDEPDDIDSTGPRGRSTNRSTNGSRNGARNGSTTGAKNNSGRTRRRRGIKPDVVILVPALTLLGRSDEPAVLEGYGPIDLDTAKELAGTAPSWLRVLTDPETGAWLSVGRKRYKPPADLRAVLRLRDGTCRSAGCTRAAADCDIDHSIPFWENGQRGETNLTNLASLCPKDHRDKHEIGWSYIHGDAGTIIWTSPTGHTYTTQPEHHIGPVALPNTDTPPPF